MKNTMQTYLSLLRAVNVLGKNLVKMPELVRILEKSGFNNVRTYIQSGNIIFSSGEKSCDILAGIIRETITKHWGFTVQVLVLTPHEMSEIVSNNPFAARKGIDHSRMHVTILTGCLTGTGQRSCLPMTIRPTKSLFQAGQPTCIVLRVTDVQNTILLS